VSAGRSGGGVSDADLKTRSCNMKWETPVAVDLRFGMEITMYVANR
jgi:coenzyme PQQ precursor peptide PqqA